MCQLSSLNVYRCAPVFIKKYYEYIDATMSQKSSKRNRQREEIDKSFKTPVSSIKIKEDNGKQDSSDDEFTVKSFSNGNSNDPVRQYQTRSRSSTPLTKTNDNAAKNSESEGGETTSNPENVGENEEAVVPNENPTQVDLDRLIFSEEMEPLVMEKDEDISELNFDENDLDVTESFEKSPNRCTTRRSKNGDVSSTPKSQDIEVEEIKSDISFDRLPEIEEKDVDEQSEEFVLELEDTQSSISTDVSTKAVAGSDEGSVAKTPTKEEETGKSLAKKPEVHPEENGDFNDTSDTYSTISTDNISTKAVAGSDVTRNADITYQDVTFEENTYTSPNHSIIESYGSLSSRRTIRPINTDYRRFALKNNCETKAEYEAVERITPGLKRKDRSLSPLGSKRFKRDGPGFLSYLTSPISNLKGAFGKSSTPTLIGFEKRDGEFDNSEGQIKIEQSDELDPQKWCSIM